MKQIINFENLEEGILGVEKSLVDYNHVEKQLILQQVVNRINVDLAKARQKEGANDVLSGILPKGVLDRLKKDKEKED